MQGIVINVMSKAKKKSASKNLGWHNAQKGKATGNRDDDNKKYNFDVLAMQGIKPIDNYNRYFKDHAHIGYNAHKEELEEGDFVVPRDNDTVSKIESIIVSPPVKVLIKDIDTFDFSEVQCFFDDYVHSFIKMDSKFKDVKVLSAKVHCNEVYYPRFEEVEQPDGTTKLRRLSQKESVDKAYVKIHMHLDYIPLVEAEKEGKKFLKLSSKDIWKAEKGRYFDSFREFNDRFHEAVGKSYGLDRGQKWEEWDIRVQKKNNGELVKEARRLSAWQLDRDEELNKRYREQLEQEAKSAGAEVKKKIREEIAQLEVESYDDFEKKQRLYKKQLEQIAKAKDDKKQELEDLKKVYDEEYDDYLSMHRDTQAQIDEFNEKNAELDNKMDWLKHLTDKVDKDTMALLNIERKLRDREITKKQAKEVVKALGLDEKIEAFRDESAREHTPNLHDLANDRDDR